MAAGWGNENDGGGWDAPQSGQIHAWDEASTRGEDGTMNEDYDETESNWEGDDQGATHPGHGDTWADGGGGLPGGGVVPGGWGHQNFPATQSPKASTGNHTPVPAATRVKSPPLPVPTPVPQAAPPPRPQAPWPWARPRWGPRNEIGLAGDSLPSLPSTRHQSSR